MRKSSKSVIAALIIGLSLVGIHSRAAADGFYFGAGAYLSAATIDGFDDTDETLGFLVGYHLIDSNVFLLSAELGAYGLGDYSGDGNKIESDAISLALNAGIPIGPFIEIYGKIGAADVSLSVNDENFDGTETFYGAGIAFDILDTVDIYLEYLEFDTEVNSDTIGIGVKLDLF